MADVRKSQTINGATLFVEGLGFIGTTSEVELPAIEFETFEGNGGVYKREINTAMLKALTTKMKLSEYNKVLYESMAKHFTEETQIYVKWNVSGKKGTSLMLLHLEERSRSSLLQKWSTEKRSVLSLSLQTHFIS
nr:phage major tail tube protein [Halarcobacter anaerophilus]